MHAITRYHDICAGHRVSGHESKCQHLHGHNYRIHFTCTADRLDNLGRVIDFSVVKEKLCMWVENNWDHKFLAWENDEVMKSISTDIAFLAFESKKGKEAEAMIDGSMVWTPFNPTAENMAEHLVEVVGPQQLEGTGVRLVKVLIEETAKCHASYEVK